MLVPSSALPVLSYYIYPHPTAFNSAALHWLILYPVTHLFSRYEYVQIFSWTCI